MQRETSARATVFGQSLLNRLAVWPAHSSLAETCQWLVFSPSLRVRELFYNPDDLTGNNTGVNA